jgi:molybdopterin-biosynthesis enzyme MoeA-like protein
LKRGVVTVSATISARIAEGRMAAALARTQSEHKSVAIGSYPFYREDGFGVQLVVRGRDADAVEAAAQAIEAAIESEGVEPERLQT